MVLNNWEIDVNDGAALLLMAFVGVVIVLVLLGNRGGGPGKSGLQWRPGFGADGTPDRPFQPTFSGPGIAFDAEHGWLWLATTAGCRLIDRADIRTWTHEWRDVSRGARSETWHNQLVFRLADLKTPVVKVDFGRNHKLAEEWQARLTSWLNG